MSSETIERLLMLCRQHQVMLRTAESCTAGAVAACIATVAGASDVLDRGWITYSNQAKMDELAVSESCLKQHGAVSQAVVEAMAQGGADEHALCISISGIAGPGGGTVEKPVGTVWMAICWPTRSILHAECYQFHGERAEIQQQAVDQAITLLLYQLQHELK